MDANFLAPVQANKKVKPFRPGDTVKVAWRVKEGDRERVQQFQGLVVRVQGSGPGASFTVRRIAANVGIERQFPFASPFLEGVEVLREGDVRRARLYYQRGLTGRHARIKERARVMGAAAAPDAEAPAVEAPLAEPVVAQEQAPAPAAPEPAAEGQQPQA